MQGHRLGMSEEGATWGQLDTVRLGRPEHCSRRDAGPSAFSPTVPYVFLLLTGQRSALLSQDCRDVRNGEFPDRSFQKV